MTFSALRASRALFPSRSHTIVFESFAWDSVNSTTSMYTGHAKGRRICAAMGRAAFLATLIRYRITHGITTLDERRMLQQPRRLQASSSSRQIYTNATPISGAPVAVGPPRRAMVQHYVDRWYIAYAEMAATLKDLICYVTEELTQATTIALQTDYSVLYHT